MSSITNIFDKQANTSSDECWKNSKDLHNKEIEDYHLFPRNLLECKSPDVRMPEMSLNHVNLRGRPGYGLSDDCLIDKYSSLRNDPKSYTTDRCPTQLFERIFTGGPRLKSDTGDINKELDLLSGSDTNQISTNANTFSSDENSKQNTYVGGKKTLMEKSTYKFTPLLDCMKDIQDPDNIVPKWVNGGADTRSHINRINFNKNCKWNNNVNSLLQ